jgi:hypothetical protein
VNHLALVKISDQPLFSSANFSPYAKPEPAAKYSWWNSKENNWFNLQKIGWGNSEKENQTGH